MEETVKKVRGEYQLVLMMLIVGIELFLFALPFLMILKLSPLNAVFGTLMKILIARASESASL